MKGSEAIMTKDGFVRELEEELQGGVSDEQLNETLQYYRSYIEEEMDSGTTEEEVLTGLGSPKLIARSVIDAYGTDHAVVKDVEYVQEEGDEDDQGTWERTRRYRKSSELSTTGQRIMSYVILIAVLLVAGLVLRFLLPFILVFFIIWFVLRSLS